MVELKLVYPCSFRRYFEVNSEHSVHMKILIFLAKILMVPIDSAYIETPFGGQFQKGIAIGTCMPPIEVFENCNIF